MIYNIFFFISSASLVVTWTSYIIVDSMLLVSQDLHNPIRVLCFIHLVSLPDISPVFLIGAYVRPPARHSEEAETPYSWTAISRANQVAPQVHVVLFQTLDLTLRLVTSVIPNRGSSTAFLHSHSFSE